MSILIKKSSMYKLALLFVIFCIASTMIAAPSNAETETQETSVARNLGLYGGELLDLKVSPISGTVFAVTLSPSGLFRSIDGAETWTGLPSDMNPGLGTAVTVDPDTGNVYALVSDDLLKSTDDGESWEDISENLGERATGEAIDYARGRLIVSIDGGQVAVSDDLGETFSFETIDNNQTVISLSASLVDDTIVAVLENASKDSEQLYRSTDGGAIWEDMEPHDNGMTEGNRFSYVVINPEDSDHIVLTSIISGDYPGYQTTDGGSTWSSLTDNGAKVNGGCLIFDTNGRLSIGFYYSDDSATAATPSWETIEIETELSQVNGNTCAADPDDPSTLYYNTSLGPAKSTDGGESWTDNIEGMSALKVYDFSQANDKDIAWIGANGGLAKSVNFTSDDPTWEYPIEASDSGTVKAVWVNPDSPDRVVAGTAVISYSDDGGETWTGATAPSFEGQVLEIVPSRITDGTLYAIHANFDLNADDTGDVLMSEDMGETWTSLEFTDNLPASELTVASDDTLYVGVGGDVTEPRVYTYDGSTWTEIDQSFGDVPITSVVLDPADDDRLFVTSENDDADGGLFVSEDAGTTWTQITEGLDGVYNLTNFTPQGGASETFYVVGQDSPSLNGVIYKSSDNGESWYLYYSGLKQESFYSLFFDGLVLGNDRGLYNLKSRAALSVLKKSTIKKQRKVSIVLRDAATRKRLSKQKIVIQHKVKGKWKKVKSVQTKKNGKAQFSVAKKLQQIRLQWTPKKKSTQEYTSTTKIIRF